MQNSTDIQTPLSQRELITICRQTGAKTIESLPAESLVFRDIEHMLHALVSRKLGERVTQTLAAQACLLMHEQAAIKTRQLQLQETDAALARIREMSPMELHDLSKAAYMELCLRASSVPKG